MNRVRTTDALYDCLSHRHRRWTLAMLDQWQRAATVRELADELAARDGGADGASDEIRLSLHHVHLPKLVDANLIRYDEDARTVSLTEYARDVTATLGEADELGEVDELGEADERSVV